MPFSPSKAVLFGLAAFASTTSAAVSLASFASQPMNLNAACATVYNAPIDGCSEADFTAGGSGCSSGCIAGLNKIQASVQKSCAGIDTGDRTIIQFFQQGKGVDGVCGKVVASGAPASPASPTKAPEKSSASASASVTNSPGTTALADSSPTASASSTFETLMVQASNSPTPSDSKPKPSRAAQLSNTDSGGGSPFDVKSSGSTSQSQALSSGMAALSIVAALFMACA